MPTQKEGMVSPTRPRPLTTWSTALFGRRAEMMAHGMEISMVSAPPNTRSHKVTGRRSAIEELTGCRDLYE